MSLYEQMTISIEAYEESAVMIERITKQPEPVVRGMISGARNMRDGLTIEAAELTVC